MLNATFWEIFKHCGWLVLENLEEVGEWKRKMTRKLKLKKTFLSSAKKLFATILSLTHLYGHQAGIVRLLADFSNITSKAGVVQGFQRK